MCRAARWPIVCFIPPLAELEHYLALVSAIEATAQALNHRLF